MGYYAHGYGYFEALDSKDVPDRFTEAMKGVQLTGDTDVNLDARPYGCWIEFRYCDQKYWEDEVTTILNALTPLVVEGSMMEFTGEDDALWAFILENGTWVEKNGHVVYE